MRQKAETNYRSGSTGSSVSSETKAGQAKDHAGLCEKIRSILASAGEPDSEDWQDSIFALELAPLIRKYGEIAVKCVEQTIADAGCGELAAGESLEFLGRLDDPPTSDIRLHALQRGLLSRSAKIRAGAVFGMAYKRDTRALPSLSRAIKKETSSMLREHMEKIRQRMEERR